MNDQKINCPNCGHGFAVEEVLEKQLRAQLEEQMRLEREQFNRSLAEREKNLNEQAQALEEKKKRENELFAQRLEKEKIRLKQSLEKEVEATMDTKMKFMEEEMTKREAELKKLKAQELDMMKERSELKRMKDDMEMRVQKELLEARQAIEAKARQEESNRNQLVVREYEKKLTDLKDQLKNAQQKAEQGSMQLQGEVQELVLEEELIKLFPFDQISEVPKGHRGADIIQTVNNRFNQSCGTIIYESKRTKAFGGDWIEKLKMDQRELGADIAVIVTETMPKDMIRFGEKDGVWICPFADAKGVASLVRDALIRVHSVRESQVNKGDKMELLYNFLTGPEFKGNLEAIVEGFRTLKDEIDRERRAMEGIWKRREKQIEKVLLNTTHMYGSVRGIAGNAIGTIQQLELPGGDIEE